MLEDTDELLLKAALDDIKEKLIENKTLKKAIIIAGASLTVIQSNESLKNIFMFICESVDVVLACRVSPKQKADIVNMIRERFPNKVTLSIGDGANDVSMI